MAVGLVPMGGIAERWAPLVTPKELLPFGLRADGRPRVLADTVFDAMAVADVESVIVPILPEKASLMMRYFGTCIANGAPIVYTSAPGPTLVANLASCVPLLRDKSVVFGMPDTVFTPVDILARCRERLVGSTELTLGIFPSDASEDLDVVDYSPDAVLRVRPKPRAPGSQSGDVWGVAAWTYPFTERLCRWQTAGHEPLGQVFQATVAERPGTVEWVMGHSYTDLGTYERYHRALADTKTLMRSPITEVSQ